MHPDNRPPSGARVPKVYWETFFGTAHGTPGQAEAGCGESTASAFAVNSRLISASPLRFSSWVSSSVSNDCHRASSFRVTPDAKPTPIATSGSFPTYIWLKDLDNSRPRRSTRS